MNKTKEEILNSQRHGFMSYQKNSAFKAMDEYVQQQAIAFAEWAAEAGWVKHIIENTWFNRMGYSTEYTTEQLYNLFLEHQKQQQ